MRALLLGALPGLLLAQAPPPFPSTPLSFDHLLQRARTSLGQLQTEALLSERQRALATSRGFLREGPSLAGTAGPRTRTGTPGFGGSSTDAALDVDLPLFLSPQVRQRLEAAFADAEPVLRQATRIEDRFRLRQAYLEAWLAERLLQLREADLATVQQWRKAARARLEAGADPAFQASLVDGEILRAQADLDEARRQRLKAWAHLRAQAELPAQPLPLRDPDESSLPPAAELPARFEASALRRAIQRRRDLDQQSLRHQEALAASRWSLRGSYAKEGEERIGKVGLTYRFPRPGETQALRRETEASLQMAARETDLALLELEARFQAALARAREATPPQPFQGFTAALQAVQLRLEEGRERPSEALPIRRQLLEAQAAAFRRLQAAQLLTAELEALTQGVNP